MEEFEKVVTKLKEDPEGWADMLATAFPLSPIGNVFKTDLADLEAIFGDLTLKVDDTVNSIEALKKTNCGKLGARSAFNPNITFDPEAAKEKEEAENQLYLLQLLETQLNLNYLKKPY